MLQHLYTIAPQPFARDPHHCLKHRHSTHASLLPGPDHQRSTVRRVPPAWLQALIVGNFIFSIAEKEVDPYPKDLKLYPTVWEVGTACCGGKPTCHR